MLFDAVAKVHGHAAAVAALKAFADSRDSEDDLRTFSVGSQGEGFNTGRSAAQHFFWSAFLSMGGNPLPAHALGNIKETYDLLASKAGARRQFDVKDLATNAAGRRLGMHIYQLWWDHNADPTGHLDLSGFIRGSAKGR